MKKTITTVAIVFLSTTSFAARVQPSATDILNLPFENRQSVIAGQDESYYEVYLKIALSEKENMNLRWQALMAAAQIRGVNATADLIKISEHQAWFMRNASLVALLQVNPQRAHQVAKKLLKDKALVVRSAAVEVLVKNNETDVRALLWEELNAQYNFKNRQSLWIRHQIVHVLSQKPIFGEMKSFAQLLSDSDSRVQVRAVRGLQKITGVNLGSGKMKESELVSLWKDYVKKENIQL